MEVEKAMEVRRRMHEKQVNFKIRKSKFRFHEEFLMKIDELELAVITLVHVENSQA